MSTVARNSVGRSCRLSRPVGSNLTARIQPVRAVKVEKEVEEAAEGARRLLSTLAGVVLCRNGVDAHCVVLQSRSCLMMGLMSHPPLSRCTFNQDWSRHCQHLSGDNTSQHPLHSSTSSSQQRWRRSSIQRTFCKLQLQLLNSN